MITIGSNGSKDCNQIVVRLDTGVSVTNRVVELHWEAGSALYANLLLTRLQTRFNECVQRSIQMGYEQGWRDAKQHKRKADAFLQRFPNRGDIVAW